MEPAPVRVPAGLTVPKVAGVGVGPVGVVAALEARRGDGEGDERSACRPDGGVRCAVRLRTEPPVVPWHGGSSA